MKDDEKTKQQLVKELKELRQTVSQLESKHRKKAKHTDALVESGHVLQGYLDTILLNLPVGVAILEGPELRYFRINHKLAELNGLPIEAHLGRPLAEVLPHATEKIIPEMLEIMKTGEPILNREFTITLPKDPDHLIHLIDYLFPIPGKDGNSIAIGAVVLEVTELRNTQTQLIQSAKLAALGEMATGVAHELNQPLQAISMITQTTSLDIEEQVYESIEENSRKILDQVARCSKIINHLRTFGRDSSISAWKHEDINTIVKNSFTLVNEQLRLHGIDVSTELSEGLPAIECNFIEIEQVLMNLFNNAKDALAKAPEKRIIVRTYQENRWLLIDVKDTGEGILAEHLDKIFDPFFTTKSVGLGTGLGLSISYSLLQKHKGEIHVRSKPGQGTLVKIRLPVPRNRHENFSH